MSKDVDASGDAILDAAAKLFRAYGLGGTSIRAVAESAGVLPGSLTYRYATKEDLILAVMRRAIIRVSDDVRSRLKQSRDPLERIKLALRAHIHALLAGDDSVFVVLFEWPRLFDESREALSRERRRYESIWDGLIYAAIGSGQLDAQLDLQFLRKFLLGAANSTIWYQPGGGKSTDEVADGIFALFQVGALSSQSRPEDLSGLFRELGVADASQADDHTAPGVGEEMMEEGFTDD